MSDTDFSDSDIDYDADDNDNVVFRGCDRTPEDVVGDPRQIEETQREPADGSSSADRPTDRPGAPTDRPTDRPGAPTDRLPGGATAALLQRQRDDDDGVATTSLPRAWARERAQQRFHARHAGALVGSADQPTDIPSSAPPPKHGRASEAANQLVGDELKSCMRRQDLPCPDFWSKQGDASKIGRIFVKLLMAPENRALMGSLPLLQGLRSSDDLRDNRRAVVDAIAAHPSGMSILCVAFFVGRAYTMKVKLGQPWMAHAHNVAGSQEKLWRGTGRRVSKKCRLLVAMLGLFKHGAVSDVMQGPAAAAAAASRKRLLDTVVERAWAIKAAEALGRLQIEADATSSALDSESGAVAWFLDALDMRVREHQQAAIDVYYAVQSTLRRFQDCVAGGQWDDPLVDGGDRSLVRGRLFLPSDSDTVLPRRLSLDVYREDDMSDSDEEEGDGRAEQRTARERSYRHFCEHAAQDHDGATLERYDNLVQKLAALASSLRKEVDPRAPPLAFSPACPGHQVPYFDAAAGAFRLKPLFDAKRAFVAPAEVSLHQKHAPAAAARQTAAALLRQLRQQREQREAEQREADRRLSSQLSELQGSRQPVVLRLARSEYDDCEVQSGLTRQEFRFLSSWGTIPLRFRLLSFDPATLRFEVRQVASMTDAIQARNSYSLTYRQAPSSFRLVSGSFVVGDFSPLALPKRGRPAARPRSVKTFDLILDQRPANLWVDEVTAQILPVWRPSRQSLEWEEGAAFECRSCGVLWDLDLALPVQTCKTCKCVLAEKGVPVCVDEESRKEAKRREQDDALQADPTAHLSTARSRDMLSAQQQKDFEKGREPRAFDTRMYHEEAQESEEESEEEMELAFAPNEPERRSTYCAPEPDPLPLLPPLVARPYHHPAAPEAAAPVQPPLPALPVLPELPACSLYGHSKFILASELALNSESIPEAVLCQDTGADARQAVRLLRLLDATLYDQRVLDAASALGCGDDWKKATAEASVLVRRGVAERLQGGDGLQLLLGVDAWVRGMLELGSACFGDQGEVRGHGLAACDTLMDLLLMSTTSRLKAWDEKSANTFFTEALRELHDWSMDNYINWTLAGRGDDMDAYPRCVLPLRRAWVCDAKNAAIRDCLRGWAAANLLTMCCGNSFKTLVGFQAAVSFADSWQASVYQTDVAEYVYRGVDTVAGLYRALASAHLLAHLCRGAFPQYALAANELDRKAQWTATQNINAGTWKYTRDLQNCMARVLCSVEFGFVRLGAQAVGEHTVADLCAGFLDQAADAAHAGGLALSVLFDAGGCDLLMRAVETLVLPPAEDGRVEELPFAALPEELCAALAATRGELAKMGKAGRKKEGQAGGHAYGAVRIDPMIPDNKSRHYGAMRTADGEHRLLPSGHYTGGTSKSRVFGRSIQPRMIAGHTRVKRAIVVARLAMPTKEADSRLGEQLLLRTFGANVAAFGGDLAHVVVDTCGAVPTAGMDHGVMYCVPTAVSVVANALDYGYVAQDEHNSKAFVQAALRIAETQADGHEVADQKSRFLHEMDLTVRLDMQMAYQACAALMKLDFCVVDAAEREKQSTEARDVRLYLAALFDALPTTEGAVESLALRAAMLRPMGTEFSCRDMCRIVAGARVHERKKNAKTSLSDISANAELCAALRDAEVDWQAAAQRASTLKEQLARRVQGLALVGRAGDKRASQAQKAPEERFLLFDEHSRMRALCEQFDAGRRAKRRRTMQADIEKIRARGT